MSTTAGLRITPADHLERAERLPERLVISSISSVMGSFSLLQSSNVFRRSVSPGLESKACLERSPGGL